MAGKSGKGNSGCAIVVVALLVLGAALLVLSLIGFSFSGSSSSSSASSSGVSTPASASSQAAGAAATTTKAVSASEVTLTATTEYLEYSGKKTDPVSLVKPSDSSATVTANSEIDLSKVGKQEVAYTIELGGQAAEKTVVFTVRDTKAPDIKLSEASPSIDQGGGFDPASFVASVEDSVDGEIGRVDTAPEAKGKQVGVEQFYDAGWYAIDGTIDANVPGAYSFMVKAADKHGNVATKELLATVREAAQAEPAPEQSAPAYTYIVNANSGKFHLPSCRDVSKMKESNKVEITATRQEMLDMGYSPCGHCNP